MYRVLIATVPVIGHIAPFFPLCRALLAKGHEVAWYSGSKYRAHIEAAGAHFFPHQHAPDLDDARLDEDLPERAKLRGIAQIQFDMKHIFIDAVPGQLADLRAIVRSFPADVVIADQAMIGPLLLQETGGPPSGLLGILPMTASSVDAAPFGLGLPPWPGVLGRIRNRALNLLVERVLFAGVQKHWNEMRTSVGLSPTGWWLDTMQRASFYFHASVPGFEYPRSDLPTNVTFIGTLPPERPKDAKPPAFWPELDEGRPIVHVTQGTLANASPDLIAPALEGLANEDVLVVVSTGKRPIETLNLRAVPDNARIATFLSYPDLLPKTAVMVTNGGYGGVQMALSHGVPLVVAGISEDKPEVAARVAWSGAGINLRTAKPTPRAVRSAVRAILGNGRYRERARALAAEYARYDAVSLAVEKIEEVARSRALATVRTP